MIQTQSQNEEIRQIEKIAWRKVRDKVRDKVRYNVWWKVYRKVWRKLFK